jgi:hypothetical protein
MGRGSSTSGEAMMLFIGGLLVGIVGVAVGWVAGRRRVFGIRG